MTTATATMSVFQRRTANVTSVQPRTRQFTGTGTLKRGVQVDRARGELFYSPERPSTSLYVLISGRVSIGRVTGEGRKLVTEVLEPGSLFGDLSLAGADTADEFAEALTDCCTLAMDTRHAGELMAADSELAGRFFTAVARRLRAASERLEEFACRSVEARLASAVLRVAGGAAQTVQVSHQILADIAGTQRETATRALNDLQARNLLRLGRRTIEVRDPRALAAVAAHA